MSVTDATDATFGTEVLASDLPVVVDFWATWCGPCRMVSPVLDELADEYEGRIRVVKVDTDANPALTEQFHVQSIPFIGFFVGGEMVDSVIGARPKAAFREKIEEIVPDRTPPA